MLPPGDFWIFAANTARDMIIKKAETQKEIYKNFNSNNPLIPSHCFATLFISFYKFYKIKKKLILENYSISTLLSASLNKAT